MSKVNLKSFVYALFHGFRLEAIVFQNYHNRGFKQSWSERWWKHSCIRDG